MRTSGQVALWSWGAWILLSLIAGASAPETPDEFFRDPEGSTAGLRVFGGLANLAFVVALVSTAIFAFKAIMDKTVTKHEYNAPVDKSRIQASHNATVATGGSQIDQSGKSIEQNTTITNYGELDDALKEIERFLQSSEEIDETQRRFGKVLVDNIRSENQSDNRNVSQLSEYIQDLKKIIDSAAGAGEGIKKAVSLLASII